MDLFTCPVRKASLTLSTVDAINVDPVVTDDSEGETSKEIGSQ